MEYICYKRYNKTAICEKKVNIPPGTKFNTSGQFIVTPDNQVICAITSFSAHNHFARNDDGQGLRRGQLVWSISSSPRINKDNNGVRWSFDEQNLIREKYSHFLKQPYFDTILFNHDFYNAEISELEEMAKDLNIEIQEVK